MMKFKSLVFWLLLLNPFLTQSTLALASIQCPVSHETIASEPLSPIEAEFIAAAPKYLQVFDIFKDPIKMNFVREQISKIPSVIQDEYQACQLELAALVLNPRVDLSDFNTKNLLIRILAETRHNELPLGFSLTKTELFSIFSYSTEDYKFVNAELRTANPSPEAKAYRNMVNQALDKIPPYTGQVKRGANLPTSEIAKYSIGAIIEYPYFLSTTADLTLTRFERKHRFLIKSKSGRDISKLSANPKEKEILFRTGSRFKILKLANNVSANGYTSELQIEMEEID